MRARIRLLTSRYQTALTQLEKEFAAGRWFTPGQRELVAGTAVAKRYPAARIGGQVRFGRGEWDIVAVIDAGRGAENSEIWGDLNQAAADLNRFEVLRSVLLEATDPVKANALVNDINSERRLDLTALARIPRPADLYSGAHRISGPSGSGDFGDWQ